MPTAIGASLIPAVIVPVAGGPTIGAIDAATIVRELAPRIVVPMRRLA